MGMLTGRKGEQGVTLVELIIVVALLGLVVAAMYNMFTFQQKSYTVQDNVAVMQQNVRVGLEYMVKEIRMAGYIPEDIPPNNTAPADDNVPGATFTTDGNSESIEEATSSAITFQADVDGDGRTETVSYTLDAGNDTLTREAWEWNGSWNRDPLTSTGPEIVAEDVESIVFTYALLADDQGIDNGVVGVGFDDDHDGVTDEAGELIIWDVGNSIDDDGYDGIDEDGPLNTEQLRNYIRQINVTMTARAANPDADYTHPTQGDSYRRRTLSSNINLRNIL